MSKLRITTERMTSISNVWLTEKRTKLTAIPQLAVLIPDIEATHKDLSLVANSPLPVNELLRASIQKLDEQDALHDQYLRAGYRLIQLQQALAIALKRPALAAELELLGKRLYPHGLTGTSLKYEEEEGAALLVEQILDEDLKKRLKSISASLETGESFTLLHCVEEHIKAAKEIGSTERLKKKLQEQEAAPSAIDGRKARFAWVDIANAVERNMGLAVRRGAATAEASKEILSDLQEAEAAADREYTQRKEKETKEKETKEATTPGKD